MKCFIFNFLQVSKLVQYLLPLLLLTDMLNFNGANCNINLNYVNWVYFPFHLSILSFLPSFFLVHLKLEFYIPKFYIHIVERAFCMKRLIENLSLMPFGDLCPNCNASRPLKGILFNQRIDDSWYFSA